MSNSSHIEFTDNVILRAENVDVYYGSHKAVAGVNLEIPQNSVVSLIGPSGCGKSTILRCFNRMNDLVPSARMKGKILFKGKDIYDQNINPITIRSSIGMVFQQPNPFPKSIYENIAWGARINGYKGKMNDLVEKSLQKAALWDEVKDNLRQSGLALSGGQQQRLCIARTIAVEPEVILMDEPCSALDPISTNKIEELIDQLKRNFTIIIVTHNMQQASRVSDYTAFFNATIVEGGTGKMGYLVEYNPTEKIFKAPEEQATREYVTGRFG